MTFDDNTHLEDREPGTHTVAESRWHHNTLMGIKVTRSASVVTLLLALLGWAVASPIGSSPDDDYHLASIWCSEFSPLYPCTTVPGDEGGASYLAPKVTVEAHVCFAFQPNQTADCVVQDDGALRLTDRLNQVQGLYPGTYYSVMSVFASSDFVTSVSAMRLFNALLVSGLLLLFLFVGAPFLQRSALLVLPVVFVPMALFIFGSTNPSSWTIMGCTFFFLFGMNAVVGRRSLTKWAYFASIAGTVVAASLAITSRVDGSAFVVVIAVAIVIMATREQLRSAIAASVAVAASAVLAAFSFLQQGLGPAGSSATIGESKYVGGLLMTNILEVPIFLAGAVGGAPLGWADTRMPGFVSTVGLLAVGALTFWGLAAMTGRKAISIVVLASATFAVPVFLAQQQRIEVLDFVQARYLLPVLTALLLAIVLVLPPSRRGPYPNVPRYTLVTLVAISGAAALWVNFHRYAFGANQPFLARNLEPQWTGLWGDPSQMIIVIGMLASSAFAFLFAKLYGFEVRAAQVESPEQEEVRP